MAKAKPRTKATKTVAAKAAATQTVAEEPESSPAQKSRWRVSGLWSEGFGKVATRSLQVIIIAVILAAIVFAMSRLSLVMIPVVLAIIFASTLWPLTKRLRQTRIPHALIAVIELVGIMALLGIIGWLITWAVVAQRSDLALQARDGFREFMEWVHTLSFVPPDDELMKWAEDALSKVQGSTIGSGAIAGVSAVGSFVTGLVLMIIMLFFFLKDGPEIWRFLLRPFNGSALARAERAGKQTVQTLGAYVRGTAIVALADAVGIGVGLAILQVPLALPLAVLVFLLAFIPLVGAVLAGILAALVALVANGFVVALIVVGIVVLVNRLEGDLLHPIVLGRTLKLHPLVILIALTIGTVLSGVLGAVLAVPIAAVLWAIIQVWDGPGQPAKAFRPHPGDYPETEKPAEKTAKKAK